MATDRDYFIRQTVAKATQIGESTSGASEIVDQMAAMKAPAWSVSEKWVTFECGCTGERCMKLFGEKNFDPVIFQGTPYQAVYFYVCPFHAPSMADRLGIGGFKDFEQWALHRRSRLMGKVK